MRTALLAAALAAAPRIVLACPVCFGQSDSPLAHGANMGVFFLLAVVAGVLASFAGFFVYLARRARAFAGSAGGAGSAGSAGNEGHVGIPQC